MDINLEELARQVRSRYTAADGSISDLAALRGEVARYLGMAGPQGSLEEIARQMVDLAGVDRLLPPCYARFQPLVTESMAFLLSRLPTERLADKIVDQLRLDPEVSPGRRVCVLIEDMPSLQKLGQIVCRSPGLTPEFKQAMVDLEDNLHTVSREELLPLIDEALAPVRESLAVTLEGGILAEASVCAVMAATVRPKGSKHAESAVLKILKPNVSRHLAHELKMLNQLATFLDQNQARWGLGDFKFKDTLQQVQWLLENEVDLTREQGNLEAVGRYYRHHPELIVPRRLPGSSPAMTVMSRVEGRKITDGNDLDPQSKRLLADALTEICILRPIKDLGERTLFHGDPHAGNIAYVFEKGKPRIILYDWGMLGRLSRLERLALALMGLGVVTESVSMVLFAADIVTAGKIFKTELWQPDLRDAVARVLDRRQAIFGDVLADIGTLFAELAYQGVVFPADLLVFQKSLVTLKGVIADVDPTFDTDEQWMRIIVGSYLGDFCRPSYYFKLYKEIWVLRRYSFVRLLQMHRLIIQLLDKSRQIAGNAAMAAAGPTGLRDQETSRC
jgi:ubiquinone biosynthesis protein